MSAQPTIKPPESLAEALAPIGLLPDEEFKELLEAVSGPRSFSLSKEQLETLKKKIPETSAILQFTLGALAYLYLQITRVVDDQMSQRAVVEKLVDDFDAAGKWTNIKSLMVDRLSALLAKQDNHQRFRKIQRLQTGFIPNATGFSSFVDLRPDYDDGDVPKEIKGFVPIIQLRIATDSDDLNWRRLVVQMDEEALAELKKTISRLESKLDALKSDPLSARLIST